jgi:uncharacterized protein with PIN domain
VAASAGRQAFIADAMLGRLAKSLRMLGYDTSYSPDAEDAELKMTALRESRVLLTRDHEIAETKLAVQVVLIESDHLEEQLVQVVEELELEPGRELFTRCLICNVEVVEVPKEKVEARVPPYVYETQDRFAECPSCGRVYWAATHVEHARDWFESVLGRDVVEGGGPHDRTEGEETSGSSSRTGDQDQ